MFSKRALMMFGLIVLFAISLMLLYLPQRPAGAPAGVGGVLIGMVAPFQKAGTGAFRFARDLWRHYFYLVSVSEENQRLKAQLSQAVAAQHRLEEVALANRRLRELLDFKQDLSRQMVAAEVVGRDPSPWFQTVIIGKGADDGVLEGAPVVVDEGIVGQVIEASDRYAKVLLLVDQNSAVDGLVQRSRARGIIKGDGPARCIFEYVLRKDDVRVGDIVISSGLDGVFPKGLRVGRVSELVRRNAGIFQDVFIQPFVDFEKLEEVLVILPSGWMEAQ